jgi:hypothetical protein
LAPAPPIAVIVTLVAAAGTAQGDWPVVVNGDAQVPLALDGAGVTASSQTAPRTSANDQTLRAPTARPVSPTRLHPAFTPRQHRGAAPAISLYAGSPEG